MTKIHFKNNRETERLEVSLRKSLELDNVVQASAEMCIAGSQFLPA